MASVEEAIALAFQHHQAGNLTLARQIYDLVIQAEPRIADVHHLLGVCLSQLGQHKQAVASIQNAIGLNPSVAAYHSNKGLAQQALGWLDEAVASYHHALRLRPDFADAAGNLAGALLLMGKLEEAEKHGRHALLLQPQSAPAHNNLGFALLRQSKVAEAIEHFIEALRIQPIFAEAHNNMGVALTQGGRFVEAVVSCKQALELQPNFAAAHNNLGHALREMGHFHEAIPCFRRAVQLKPDFTEALHNLGTALQLQGGIGEARLYFEEVQRLDPDFGLAHLNLGVICLAEGKLAEAQACIDRARLLLPGSTDVQLAEARLFLARGQLKDAQDVFRIIDRNYARRVYLQHLDDLQFTTRINEFDVVLDQACSLFPNDAHLDAALLYRHHFDDTLEPTGLSAEYRRWSAEHFSAAAAGSLPAVPRDDQDRVRVAYVGTYLHHSFMDNVLRYYDRSRFDVLVFTDDVRVDLAKAFPGIKVYPVEGHALVKSCRDQGVAIAVDVVGPVPFRGGTAQLTAFQQRLAPIQCLWIATLNTTGSPAYDYLIADWQMIDPDHEGLYTEHVARLPDVWLCWTPPAATLTPGLLPARRDGNVTFGSANRAFKMNSTQLRLWAQVLTRCPGSRFHVKGPAARDEEFIKRFQRVLADQGLSPDRILWSPFSAFPDYLGFYQEIDISLDTYPYNGGITTLESLWMGVPVISRSGSAFTSRFSRSYLHHLGYMSWVATSDEEYVQRACGLAADLDALEQVRQTLREKLVRSAICDGRGFTNKLERLYAKMLEAGGRTNVAV